VEADGLSLDDKRTPMLPPDKLGPTPATVLAETDQAKNNLPDVLARWSRRNGSERERARTEQSFCVSRQNIQDSGYSLSINQYKEFLHEEVEHRLPADIFEELERIEGEIQQRLSALKGMLG